ncbi:Glutaminase kidney isoform, mitochondrial [Portunus trituberculatus]|uniref:glutaminase n=1 Tax=Portunus trituberculatus TaxID=210409 RepID=A0A5B7DIF3_PORTR|nr:Glutaminase kidney isoform, mitochondrial [Portunus trituberculatus]
MPCHAPSQSHPDTTYQSQSAPTITNSPFTFPLPSTTATLSPLSSPSTISSASHVPSSPMSMLLRRSISYNCRDLVKQHLGHVENRLFEMFGDEEKRTININKFLMGLTATGMRPSDPRLKQTKQNLKKLQDQMGSEFVSLDIDYETFMGIISENLEIVVKAFSANFVIPDFQGFCKQMEEIYNKCYANHSGKPAQYIPQLARYDSKSWGMAICTVDGQRFSLGDVEVPFTIQSCSKPLTYATGLAVNGCDYMHNYVGMEPSGRYFNELVLDYSSE